MFGINLKELLIKKVAKKFLPKVKEKAPEYEIQVVKWLKSIELNKANGEMATMLVVFPDKEGKLNGAVMITDAKGSPIRLDRQIRFCDFYEMLSDPNILEHEEVKKYLDQIQFEE